MRVGLPSLLVLLVLPIVTGVPAYASFEPVTCHNPFTQQQEIDEGQKVALKVYQQMPVLPENDPVSIYLRQVGARLVAAAPLTPGLTRQWPFSFHVVASSEINAFALPGGSMFVDLGAIQAAETESQLAGVMAHEMSHVIMRHSTCNMVQQQHRGIFYSLGEIGSSIFLGRGAIGSLAAAGFGMGEKLDFLHMSREDEKQADLLGVNIVHAAGYDPRGLAQFFEIIVSKSGGGGAQFLSDHPNPGNRTEYVDAEISTLSPRTAATIINTPEFRRIHALTAGERTFTAKQVANAEWKQVGGYISAPGQTLSRSGDSTGSQQQPGSQQPRSAPSLTPLNAGELGLGGRFAVYQAPRWSISVPADWVGTPERAPDQSATVNRDPGNPDYGRNGQGSTNDQTGSPPSPSVQLAPPGGAGSFGIAYGVMVSIARVSGNGVHNQQQLSDATTQLLQNLLSSQPGLSQSGGFSAMQIAGQPALAINLSGRSPVETNGSAEVEHDWMITVARSDGDVSALIFVAPEPQFDSLKPTFDLMLQSFRPL